MRRRKISDKKHIIHVMGYDSKKYGILEEYVLNLALMAREHDFEIVYVYNKKPKSEIFLKKLEKFEISYFVANAMSAMDFWKVFYKLTRKYRPILVHSHFQPLLPSFYAWILGYKHRWNTIRLMLVDKDIREVQSKKQLKISSRVYRYLINLFTNNFFCVSNAVYQQYYLVYPRLKNRLNLLYNGVPMVTYDRVKARENLNFEKSTIYICSIAFASKTKGTDILIKAFQDLISSNNITEVKLCLIGLDAKSDLTKKLFLMINNYNLREKVINFGIIDNVGEVLPAMDIYVQPSRSESLSNALIEAGLYGIPAVGTNVGGIPEVIIDGKTGFLFPFEDHKTLSKKLKILIEDKVLINKMGREAHNYVSNKFLMDKKINELLAHYKSIA